MESDGDLGLPVDLDQVQGAAQPVLSHGNHIGGARRCSYLLSALELSGKLRAKTRRGTAKQQAKSGKVVVRNVFQSLGHTPP